MTADPVIVPASAVVDQFLHNLLPWLRYSAFPLVDDAPTVVLSILMPRAEAFEEGADRVMMGGDTNHGRSAEIQ